MPASTIHFAALDPQGPVAFLCGLTWALLWTTSGVAALVSAALCTSHRTARQALRLSRVGVWAWVIALVAILISILTTADNPEAQPSNIVEDSVWAFFLGLPPVIAFFTGRYSRRKLAEPKPAQPVG